MHGQLADKVDSLFRNYIHIHCVAQLYLQIETYKNSSQVEFQVGPVEITVSKYHSVAVKMCFHLYSELDFLRGGR